MADIRLDGKVAVITGATGGWGSGAARALVARGAAVVLNARTQSKLDLLADRLNQLGGQAFAVAQDVTTMEGARHVMDNAVERYGQVDILVSAVGATVTDATSKDGDFFDFSFWGGSILDLTVESWDHVIGAELTAVFTCTKAAADQMVEQGHGGSIILLGGGGGMFGMPGASAHAAAKGGLASAMWSWSDELKPHAITVNAIRGWVSSAISDPSWSLEGEDEDIDQRRGFGSASAAPLVVWLASPEASDITGCYIGIDGARATIWEPKPPDTTVFNQPEWTPEGLQRTLAPVIRRRPPRPRLNVLTDEFAEETSPSQ